MLKVATDGACKGNPGKGTWAFVVFDDQDKMLGHRKGHSVHTTNNEMELTAILEALHWATKNEIDITILTDSSYCYNGITKWMDGWKAKGWKSSTGKEIANLDLWMSVYSFWTAADFHLSIEKVKGHSGNKYNDAADMYCNEEYLNAFM